MSDCVCDLYGGCCDDAREREYRRTFPSPDLPIGDRDLRVSASSPAPSAVSAGGSDNPALYPSAQAVGGEVPEIEGESND